MNIRQSVDPALLIPELEGKNLANLLSVPYFECSYVTGEGIKALFYEAASLLVNSDKFESYKEIEKDVDDGIFTPPIPLFPPLPTHTLTCAIPATEKILANILDEHLNLSFSELGTKAHFPKEIKYCSNLTSIDLSWNGFTKVPLELKDILSLRKLNLASNKLTDVNGIETMVFYFLPFFFSFHIYTCADGERHRLNWWNWTYQIIQSIIYPLDWVIARIWL